MKLSMWILKDWLQKYSPDVRITEGFQALRGVRLFSEDVRIEVQNVYLGKAKDFISTESEDVICINGHDMLILKTIDIEGVLNDIFDAFDFYNRWADTLISDVYSGCSLQNLVDKSKDVFNTPVTVFDSGNILMAYSKEYPLGSLDKEWDTILSTKNMSLETLQNMKDHLLNSRTRKDVLFTGLKNSNYSFLVRNLFYEQENMGKVVINLATLPFSQGTAHLCDSLAHIIETWLSFNKERNEMLNKNNAFINILSGKNIIEKELFRKLDLSGWKDYHEKILININNLDFQEEIFGPLLNSLEYDFPFAFTFKYNSQLLMIVNLDIYPLSSVLPKLLYNLKRSESFCAVSYEFSDIMKLPIAFEQTEATLLFCPGTPGEIYFCQDYALSYMINVLQSHIGPNLIHPALSWLKNNDSENDGELFHTLFQFLSTERNLVKTAEKLNIHRNTLVYRLNKIKSFLDINFDDYETRLYLILSYEILKRNG